MGTSRVYGNPCSESPTAIVLYLLPSFFIVSTTTMSSRIPSSSMYSTSVHPSPVRPGISSASSSTTSLQTSSSTNTLPPAPGVVTVEAVLAQHSASFDPKLAALEQSLNERNTLSLQNAQLWKLIEKQRSGYNQILKELERVRSERDGYKSRLAAAHNSPHSDRRHRNHDRTHQPAPAPSESPVPSSESGSLNEEHTPVTKHSTHRHRSDEQGMSDCIFLSPSHFYRS